MTELEKILFALVRGATILYRDYSYEDFDKMTEWEKQNTVRGAKEAIEGRYLNMGTDLPTEGSGDSAGLSEAQGSNPTSTEGLDTQNPPKQTGDVGAQVSSNSTEVDNDSIALDEILKDVLMQAYHHGELRNLNGVLYNVHIRAKVAIEQYASSVAKAELERPLTFHVDDAETDDYKRGFADAIDQWDTANERRCAALDGGGADGDAPTNSEVSGS